MMKGTAGSVLQGRRLPVKASPPTINRGAGNIKAANGSRNAEVERIIDNRLTKTSDL